jgi:hypothetical protein
VYNGKHQTRIIYLNAGDDDRYRFITELNNARAQDETDKKQEDEEAADTEDAAEYVVVEDAVSTGVSLHTTEQQLTMRQAAIADAAGRSEIIEALERIDLIERPEEILASKEDADGKIEKVYLDQAASTDNTKPVDTMKAEEKETNEAIITSNTTQTICKVVETSQMPDTSVHTETTTREINVVKVSEEQEVAISSDVAEDVAKMLQTERPVVTEEVTVEEITLASGTTITNTTTKVKAIIKGAMVETTTVETKTVSDEEQVVPMLATVEETATSVPDTAPGQNETSDDDSWSAVEREEIQDAPETVSTEATNVATTTSIAPDTDESAKSTA